MAKYEHHPACPRCGYDVSGVISTWANECPLNGKCSECGYEYQWKHLLGPNLGVPKWFFESAQRRLVRSAISTSVRTLAPWHFWKRVPVHAPIRFQRLLMLGVCAVIVLYLGTVVSVALPSFVSAYEGQEDHLETLLNGLWIDPPTFSTRTERLERVLEYLPKYAQWPQRIGTTDWMGHKLRTFPVALSGVALIGPCLWVLGQFRRPRVRVRDVVRASIYPTGATAIAFLLLDISSGAVLFHQTQRGDFMWWQLRDTHDLCVRRGCIIWSLFMVLWWWCWCRFHLATRGAFLLAIAACAMAYISMAWLLFPITAPDRTWNALIRW